MTLADETLKNGWTSATTVGGPKANGAAKNRGVRRSKVPTKMAWCHRHQKETLHDTCPTGGAHNCLECRRLMGIAMGRKLAVQRKDRQADPNHNNYWTGREVRWRNQKIECIQGCASNDGWACRAHYVALMILQQGRCALCERVFYVGIKPHASVDHLHRDADGRGPMRGLLCGGKTGCNFRVGHFEQGRSSGNPEFDVKIRAYIESPPASRLT